MEARTNPSDLGHLRKAGLELCHELMNQLGVAVGSVDLVRDEIDEETPRSDLDRALRALAELDRLISEAQGALRRGAVASEPIDVVLALRDVVEQASRIPGALERQIRHRLPDHPVPVQYPADALAELIGRVVVGEAGSPVDLLLQERLTEPDASLPAGHYCVLMVRGGRSGTLEEGWSFEAERFRVRSYGGDLRRFEGSWLVFLPLAEPSAD